MKTNRLAALLSSSALAATLALSGCTIGNAAAETEATTSSATAADPATENTAQEVLAANQDLHKSQDALDYDESSIANIELNGDSVTSDSAEGLTIDGSTITISAAGTYRLTGNLDDGQVEVNSTDEGTVRLILDNASLTSSTTSPLVITEADNATVVLAEGSSNSLTDTDEYAEEDEAGAALDSSADLTIAGTGSLTVNGNGNDGISSADGLIITGGLITVNAADDGIRGKDYLVVEDGTIDITAGGDGLKSDNEEDAERGFIALQGGAITIEAGADGAQASTDAIINGADVSIVAGGGADEAVGGSSTKGIKGGTLTLIESGMVAIDSSDDALHSDTDLYILGGDLKVATGDDGIHADANVQVEGGTIIVSQSYEAIESAYVTITGGDIDLTASDDGINASVGSATEDSSAQDTTETEGGAPGGGMPGQGSAPAGPPPGAVDGAAPDGTASGAEGGQAGPVEIVDDAAIAIVGGNLQVDSDGDGLDSNGTMTISGGSIVVSGTSSNWQGALDSNGEFTISGGELLANGSAGMVVNPAVESEQAWFSLNFEEVIPAGADVEIHDEEGNELASFTTLKDSQNVTYSSSVIATGQTYQVVVDGTTSEVIAGETPANTASDGPGSI